VITYVIYQDRKESTMKRFRGLMLMVCLSLFVSGALMQRKASMKDAPKEASYLPTTATINPPAFIGSEVMTDRCSAEVAIVPSFVDRPETEGTIILKRAQNGTSEWTPPFTVKLGSAGHIRWWCHSTTGNVFDPGTWRLKGLQIGTKCEIFADGRPESCRPDAGLQVGSSAWKGWTPERSRCDDRSNRIRARLGPNRLLQIECLGK
jgi:hypothetical protein